MAALGCVLAADNKACSLVTPDELEGALGAKVGGMSGSSTGSDVQMCTGKTDSVSVLVRMAKSRGGSGDAAAKGVALVKKMGAQVEVKTFGPITCSTITPPKNMEQYGFNTTGSVVKGGQVAAIEVTAKAKGNAVAIEKLRPVAEKMAGRF